MVPEQDHTSSDVMLCYHRADSILLKCLRNLNYVCFAELVESDVVRKPLMMATKMTPV